MKFALDFRTELLTSQAFYDDVSTTGTVVGVVLLCIPYFCIIVPGLRDPLVNRLTKLYFHKTPRTDWNPSVDSYPPRRVAGFILGVFSLCLPIFIISYYYYDEAEKSSEPIDLWLYFLQYLIYVSLPLLMSIIRPAARSPCDIGDVLILALILVPMRLSDYDAFDKHFLPDIRISIRNTWPRLSLLKMTALNVGILVYYVLRPLQDIGLGWTLKYTKLHWISLRWVIAAIVFCCVAVPVAAALEFIKKSHEIEGNVWMDGVLKYFIFFLLVSLPFEFLFRGICQNLLHSWADSRAQERHMRLDGLSDTVNSRLYDNVSSYDTIVTKKIVEKSKNNNKKNKKSKEQEEELVIEMKDPSPKPTRPLTKLSDPLSDMTHATHHYYGNLGVEDNVDPTTYSTLYPNTTIIYGSPSKSYLPDPKETCGMGAIWWLNFYHIRDWSCLIVSSLFYALIVTHFEESAKHADRVVAAFFIVFWLGMCCGWVWRHTNSVFAAAVLNSLILYVAEEVFVPKNAPLCNGAC